MISYFQVVIFLSGYCLPNEKGPVGDVEVYYDIAKACSGAMLKWDSLVDLREVRTISSYTSCYNVVLILDRARIVRRF